MLISDVKVSVVMSTYNDARYISKAVDSILNQTHSNLELLVMVDGSTDETVNILSGYEDSRLRFYVKQNRGKAASLNDLISQAAGEYIVIQDSDDISHPDRLIKLLGRFSEAPEIALLQSGYSLIVNEKIIAPTGRDISPKECEAIIAEYRLPGLDPTVMVRADVAKKYPFNPEYKVGQGVDFIFRVAESYPMAVMKEPLYFYRYNVDSNTKRNNVTKMHHLCEVMNSARIRRGDEIISESDFISTQGGRRTAQDNNLSGHFTESVFVLIQSGNRLAALKVALFSLRYAVSNYRFIKPMIYAVSPRIVGVAGRKLFGEQARK